MQRDQLILSALAAGGEGAEYTPVQVQKLLFVIDREASHLFDGPHFKFEPYDYGPFDRNVYDQLDVLALAGKTIIGKSGRYRSYYLSQKGRQEGAAVLENMEESHREYLEKAAQWVRSLSFEQLVSAIYRQYPDMKVNSVFNG